MKELMQSFSRIKLSDIEPDRFQPRQDLGTEGERNRLTKSLKMYGLQTPFQVLERKGKKFLLIDGHRRYSCLTKMNIDSVQCLVYAQEHAAEIDILRHETQNNRRSWKPIERAYAYERLKRYFKVDDSELAKRLGVNTQILSSCMTIKEQHLSLISSMDRHSLSASFQREFVRLFRHLDAIGQYQLEEVTEIILSKISSAVIKNCKELRTIGGAFARPLSNEVAILKFLNEKERTTQLLRRDSLLTSFALDIDRVVRELALRRENKLPYLGNEIDSLAKLKISLADINP